MWQELKRRLAGDFAQEMTSLRFEFRAPGGTTVAILLLVALALATALLYWPQVAKLSPGRRLFVVGMRVGVLLLTLFMFLDPCIVGEKVEPGAHYVAILFDDSNSMKIVGNDGKTRGERMKAAYGEAVDAFETTLGRRYQLAKYRFGATTERVRRLDDLTFEARESDLTGAVGEALHSLQGVQVSGVVIFSDGIQQAEKTRGSLVELAAAGVPVYTVGVDSPSQWRDLEIGPLAITRTEFDRSPVVMTFPVRAIGLGGQDAIVEVVLGDRIVKAESLTIGSDEYEQEMRVEFVPEERGWLEYEVRARLAETGPAGRAVVREIAVAGKDGVVENNTRRFLIDNRRKEFRVLYFSGRPTWEYKFFNRALFDDEQLRLTGLIRIAPKEKKKFEFRGRGSGDLANPLFQGFDAEREFLPRYDEATFIRINIGEKSELETGYPLHPAELYAYDLVIWSEIESDFFAPRQLELTRDYVGKRGGSLLLVGGPMSFASAGYAGTVIESMLPIALDPAEDAGDPNSPDSIANMKFSVEPTIDGLLSGTWALDANMDESRRLWRDAVELTGLNVFLYTRPGATVLAQAAADRLARDRSAPLFVQQRYGEGRTAVLATGSTWQWQLDADLEDELHERLWRQVVRSLVNGVSAPIHLRDKSDAYTLGNPVKLEFLVRDEVFETREGLRVSVKLKDPEGREEPLAVDESLDVPGLYSVEFNPEKIGSHLVSLEALDDADKLVGRLEAEALIAQPDRREFANPQYNPDFLRRLADETGGRFFTLDRIADIPDRIPYALRENAEKYRIHLWHKPPLFVFALLMLSAEWWIRRKKGYA